MANDEKKGLQAVWDASEDGKEGHIVMIGCYNGLPADRAGERVAILEDEGAEYHMERNTLYDCYVVLDRQGRAVHYNSSASAAYMRVQQLNKG